MFSVVLRIVKVTVFNRWMREVRQKVMGILVTSSSDMLLMLTAQWNN